MDFLKNKIKDDYAGQSVRNDSFFKTRGNVILADVKTCTCSVTYIDKYGEIQEESRMPVQTNTPDSWFPKAGDSVIIEQGIGKPLITGRWLPDYSKQIYKESRLLSDIFPDTSNESSGGTIQ